MSRAALTCRFAAAFCLVCGVMQATALGAPPDRARDDPWTLYWDGHAEGGYGVQWNGEESWAGIVGGRLGVSFVNMPWFLSVGATAHWPPPHEFASGIEFEILHLWTGFHGRVGVAGSLGPHLVMNAGVGWSVLGVDLRLAELDSGDPSASLLFTLRIPVSMIVLAASR